MRVVLDLDSGIVATATDYIPGLNRSFVSIPVSLGDLSLEVQLMRSGTLAQLTPCPASLKFVANPYNIDGSIDFDSGNIVLGQVDLATAAPNDPSQYPVLKCGEDWAAAGLIALFTTPDLSSVNLRGQYLWRVSSDPAYRWRQSRDFDIAVRNTLVASTLVPGAVLLGNMFYLSTITRLTGGVVPSDLDSVDISVLPDLSVLRVVITGRGESSWRKETDATTPATDTDAGTIRPTNYDAALRPYVLRRQSGF